MGWRAACGLLVLGVVGCGVHLGYSDAEVVEQADPPPAKTSGSVLDAQVVTAPEDTDANVPVGNDPDATASPPGTPPSSPVPGPCASCPSGTAQSLCISSACVAVRRVFVSSVSSSANLGGTPGADTRCQNLANTANLGGNWRAWVSTSTSSPNGRFTKANVSYRLLDGNIVANDWSDLTSGTLRHAIDRDEKNVFIASMKVWTATTSAGTYEGGGCNGFASSASGAPFAAQGVTDRASGQWTNVYLQYCDRTNPRIYCFEQ